VFGWTVKRGVRGVKMDCEVFDEKPKRARPYILFRVRISFYIWDVQYKMYAMPKFTRTLVTLVID
jgi:hypothetical protein